MRKKVDRKIRNCEETVQIDHNKKTTIHKNETTEDLSRKQNLGIKMIMNY